MLTLQQLVTSITEDEALTSLLTILTQLGFQATSWQSGSIQLTILRMMARIWSSLSTSVQQIAAGGFTTLAGSGEIPGTSPFLTLLAKHVYAIERIPAQATIGTIVLTSSAAAPLHTWVAGDIVVSDQPSGTAGANTYTVQSGGSLAPDSTIAIAFKADIAGQAGNIAPGTTLFLWTPFVGVTATNPAIAGSSTWITTPGQDEESDSRLMTRCMDRWSRLSPNNINGAYEGWAFEALPELTRLSVGFALGDGNVTLIGATDLGPLTIGQCNTISDFINGVTDGKGRKPLNDILNVVGATTLSSPAITIDAFVTTDVFDTIVADMTALLLDYIGSVPIGGTKLNPTGAGVILYSQLVHLAQGMSGVRKVSFSISGDVTLANDQIYTPTITVVPHLVQPGT